MSKKSNYDKAPFVKVSADPGDCITGWGAVLDELTRRSGYGHADSCIIAIECYTGVYYDDLLYRIRAAFPAALIFDMSDALYPETEIREMTQPYLTDDPVFGIMNDLEIEDFQDNDKFEKVRSAIAEAEGPIIIFGHGASTISESGLIVYADMARWEIQMRMRRGEVDGLGVRDRGDGIKKQYKRGYFVDWRVCDRLKQRVFDQVDLFLDTNDHDNPKLVTRANLERGLRAVSTRPHRVVPFFDPGPWGGQWMKKVCDLDRDAINYAWCFDCVPEENSLLLKFGDTLFETPSINTVLFEPLNLLGGHILETFGKEFPIRFDFLDTMEGGNLSLQVHPTARYIRDTFNMTYTQDESYYLLDTGEGAHVYLGLKEGIDPSEMIEELHEAQQGQKPFSAEDYVNKWPVSKHDHVLIPAGTVHCSGRDSMVLEISATPYIFTFKLWDWGRLGLDGKPRPIHIEHGSEVIQWDRTTEWVGKELINAIELLDEGDGWREERTGLHKLEFIETRRHWFRTAVQHSTGDTVNVLNLVEGREAVVESPSGDFDPFVVHYAETFIVPASVGRYTIRPHGESEGLWCATIKAFIRNPLY